MKKTIFTFKLIILLLSSINVSGQYDSFPAPPGYVDHQFPTYPADSFYITKHGSINPIDTSRISPKVFCPTPLAKDAASIVHYTNGIVAFVELDTFISGLQYYKRANDEVSVLLSLSNKGIILRNLSENTKYTLSVINSCSDTVIMSIFRTDKDPANAKSLEINGKLYKYLSTWQTREDTTNLYSYLQSIPNLHNIEKISLLQRWFMADTSLTLIPGSYNSGGNFFPFPPKSVFHKRGGCNCKFLIKTSKQHIGIISPADVKPWGSVWAHSYSESGSWGGGNNRADWYLGKNSKGPSKSHFQLGHGKGVERDKITLQGGPNIGTPYYAVREMSYTCANYNLYMDNCACDRTLNIKYLYEGRARAETQVTQCFLCNERKAFAQVEDWAVVTYTYDRTGVTKVLAANNVAAYSEDKYKINKQFYIDALGVATTLTPVIISIATGVPMPGLIDSIANGIKKAINLPPYGIGNSVQKSPVDFQLLNSSQDIILPVNNPVIVTLSSYSTHQLKGKNKWKTSSGVASNFMLSLRHNFDTESLPTCCGPSVGTWALASFFPESQSSYSTLQNLVTSHYWIYGDWWPGQNVGIDFGSLEGKPIQGCTTQYQWGWDLKTNNHKTMDVIPSANSTLILKLEKNRIENKELTEYTIFDIQGKILKQGFAHSGEIIWQNNPLNLEMIFVRLNNSTGSITKKFVFIK